jgi:hypothetical protein
VNSASQQHLPAAPSFALQHKRGWLDVQLSHLSFDGAFVQTSEAVPPNHLVILRVTDKQGEFILHARSVPVSRLTSGRGFAIELYGDSSKRSPRWAMLVRSQVGQ